MLSFSLVAEAVTGLIYHRPLGENSNFQFTPVDQIISLVTNVVIQVAQLQLCTKNLPEKLVQAKSDLSKQIAEGKQVFESIISRPVPPAPFVFSSTLVEKKKVLLKASTILDKATPSLASSSNITKSTKTPSIGPQRKSTSKLPPPQNRTSSTKPSPNKPTT